MATNQDEYCLLAKFYDAIYAWRMEDIVFYLEEACSYPGPVLEAGCGTGRITLPLAELLPEVYALDSSPAMLQILEEKCRGRKELTVFPIQGQFQTFQSDLSFGQIFVPFRAFLHLLDQESQVQALRNFHRHLRSDGRLVIDFFSPDYKILMQKQAQSTLPEVLLEDGSLLRICDESTFDHTRQWILVNRRVLTVHPEGREENILSAFCLRYVFRYEMELLLRHAGFRIEAVYGGFDRRPYEQEGGEMIFIARPATFPS